MLAVNENLLHLLHCCILPISALSAYCYTIGNSLHSNKCAASDIHIAQAFKQTLFQFQLALSALICRVVQVQGSLDGIESHLDAIGDLVVMENGILIAEQSGVLAGLLTFLGLNQQWMERLDSQLRSRQEITCYRALATWYVTGTLSGLTDLEEALEVLRSLAIGAGLIDKIPMEVIISALSKGVERLHWTSKGNHALTPLLTV